MSSPTPDFSSAAFLQQHIESLLSFYEDRAVDPAGGFFHTYTDTGDIYDPGHRHLVSSTRFVFNYAQAFRRYQQPQYLDRVIHGLDFLRSHHLQPSGHYAWELRDGRVSDGRAMAYGHAFVMLAGASALEAGVEQGAALIEDIWNLLESHFWEPDHRAYADEYNDDLSVLSAYRGQNANMHTCEALIAAWQATRQSRYLTRAMVLAKQFAVTLAGRGNGQIWEHYHTDWQHDFDYNRDKPDDLFKPWGYQPGHQLEWAKLLLQLHSLTDESWLLDRAIALYEPAMDSGWDQQHGGLVYGYGPDGTFADAGKYFWVQAEGFAAAWRLWQSTKDERFLQDYLHIWSWSWEHLVDHEHGAWFRVLTREGNKVDNLKSPPGKTDYHTMGACWDVLDNLRAIP